MIFIIADTVETARDFMRRVGVHGNAYRYMHSMQTIQQAIPRGSCLWLHSSCVHLQPEFVDVCIRAARLRAIPAIRVEEVQP